MSYTSTEVKAKYNAKAYQRYTITLRRDSDQELISMIEELKLKGLSPTEAVKKLIRAGA